MLTKEKHFASRPTTYTGVLPMIDQNSTGSADAACRLHGSPVAQRHMCRRAELADKSCHRITRQPVPATRRGTLILSPDNLIFTWSGRSIVFASTASHRQENNPWEEYRAPASAAAALHFLIKMTPEGFASAPLGEHRWSDQPHAGGLSNDQP
jgi:hypothetical protein